MKKRRLHWLVCLVMMLGMMIGAVMSAQEATKTITWGKECFDKIPYGSTNGFKYDGISITSSGSGAYIKKDTNIDRFGKSNDELRLYIDKNSQDYFTFTSEVGKIETISIEVLSYLNPNFTGWEWNSSPESILKWTGTPAESVILQKNHSEEARIKFAGDTSSGYSGSIIFTVDATAVTSVSLNKESTSLTVGGTEALTAKVSPTDATNKSVSWSSSNTDVATVDSNGKVTAIAAGTATITVTTADGNKTATCTVTVTKAENETETKKSTVSYDTKNTSAPPMASSPINSLDSSIASLQENAEPAGAVFHVLCLEQMQANKKSITVGWNSIPGAAGYRVYGAQKGSAYQKLADVNGTSFKQKNILKGTSYKYIVAAYDSAGNVLSVSKPIYVSTNGKNPNGVKLSKNKANLSVNETFQIGLKNKKTYKTGQVRYESSNTAVATVSADGTVTAVGSGNCSIFVYAKNGVYAKCKITVK